MPERSRARFGQRHRIAFAFDIAWIGIHLVEEEPARRHRSEADGAVRAGKDELPAREAFHENRVAAAAHARRHHDPPQFGAFVDQRFDALLRQALCKTVAAARARSTSSPLIFASRTLRSCALITSLAVRVRRKVTSPSGFSPDSRSVV